ncbi:hypothetical protein EW145_g8474, partial [Phellinidium pouzarii]
MPHLAHTHSHLHSLPSPPSRPQAIVIPVHGGPGGALSPLGGMGALGSALSPLGVGQASGWFLPGATSGGNSGSTPGAEFSLPTPESVHGTSALGQFGTSAGSMGISPKDMTLSSKGDSSPPLDAASKQAAIVNEKRRRRRESHNAVERRRRDNINEKISELATLIPEVMLDPGAPSTGEAAKNKDACAKDCTSEDGGTPGADGGAGGSGSGGGGGNAKDAAGVKTNKGMILRKSVEYIRYLQQLVGAQAERNRALEEQLVRAGLSLGGGEEGGMGDDGDSEDVVEVTRTGERVGKRGFHSTSTGLGHNHHFSDAHGFGADVLGMHAFDMDVGLGMGGFCALEPMAEGSEMEMEMELEREMEMEDMDMDGGSYGGGYASGRHKHLNGHALTNGNGNGITSVHSNGNGNTNANGNANGYDHAKTRRTRRTSTSA